MINNHDLNIVVITSLLIQFWPAALADPTGKEISLTEDVVCLSHVWAQRSASSYTQGKHAGKWSLTQYRQMYLYLGMWRVSSNLWHLWSKFEVIGSFICLLHIKFEVIQIYAFICGWCSGAVVSTVTLQQEGSGSESRSLHIFSGVVFLQVLTLWQVG